MKLWTELNVPLMLLPDCLLSLLDIGFCFSECP